MIMEIKLEVSGGSNLKDIVSYAKNLAIGYHCHVKFEFNSIEVIISPSGASKYTETEIGDLFFEEFNRPRRITI